MPEPPPSEKSVFLEAIEITAAERAVYLDRVCQDNPQLRAETKVVLLAADGTTERAIFLLKRCLPLKLKAPPLISLRVGQRSEQRHGGLKVLLSFGHGINFRCLLVCQG